MSSTDKPQAQSLPACEFSAARYQVTPQRGTARIKVRYIETNKPASGCTFCA